MLAAVGIGTQVGEGGVGEQDEGQGGSVPDGKVWISIKREMEFSRGKDGRTV